MTIKIVTFFIIFSAFSGVNTGYGKDTVDLYLFYSEECPHCADEKKFLKELQNRYPELQVHLFEVWNNDEENAALFQEVLRFYGIQGSQVPVTIVGESEPLIGYFNARVSGAIIENRVRRCIDHGCENVLEKFLQAREYHGGFPGDRSTELLEPDASALALPFFGEGTVSTMSIPLLTGVLALFDSINPCAFFILTLLLGLLTGTKSSRRVLFIGGVFVFFSAGIYFLFMAAWLNLFFLTGRLRVVTVVAGGLAMVIGIVNMKDFFTLKKGITLGIPETKMPLIFQRIRNLMVQDSVGALVPGTILLAVTANTYELFCTAGFPMVYTRILTLHNLRTAEYYLFLAMYNIIYVIPLMIIVALYTVTLGRKKLSERQVKTLKLASGMMMLALGAVLLVNPSLLHRVWYAVLIVTGSAALAVFISRKRRHTV